MSGHGIRGGRRNKHHPVGPYRRREITPRGIPTQLKGPRRFRRRSVTGRGGKLAELAKDARAWLGLAEASRLGVQAGDALELTGPGGVLTLPAGLDDSVPSGAVFVPYAYEAAAVNRLGMPKGAGLRVAVRKVASASPATA